MSGLDATYNDQWGLMKDILTDFVELMSNLPVPQQEIRRFFEAIDSLSKSVAFIEDNFGPDTAQAIFHRFGKDKDTADICQIWKTHLEKTIKRTDSKSAKELLEVIKNTNIGSYLTDDVLPYFRRLANQRDGLMKPSAAAAAGVQQFERKQHLGFSVGHWTELEVVRTYIPGAAAPEKPSDVEPTVPPTTTPPRPSPSSQEKEKQTDERTEGDIVSSPDHSPDKHNFGGKKVPPSRENVSERLPEELFNTAKSDINQIYKSLGIKGREDDQEDDDALGYGAPKSKDSSKPVGNKPPNWENYHPSPGNEEFDNALYLWADKNRRQASKFRKEQEEMETRRYELKKLVDDCRVQLLTVSTLKYTSARDLLDTIEEDLTRLCAERNQQLLNLPGSIRFLDNWLTPARTMVETMVKDVEAAYADSNGAIARSIQRELAERRPKSPGGRGQSPGTRGQPEKDPRDLPTNASPLNTCPYAPCIHQADPVAFLSHEERMDHFYSFHPAQMAKDNSKVRTKSRSRSASVEKNVAFDDDCTKGNWAEDEEEEGNGMMKFPVSDTRFGINSGRSSIFDDDERSVPSVTVYPTVRRKTDLPSKPEKRGGLAGRTQAQSHQTLTLNQSARSLRLTQSQALHPSGLLNPKGMKASARRDPQMRDEATTRRVAAGGGGGPPGDDPYRNGGRGNDRGRRGPGGNDPQGPFNPNNHPGMRNGRGGRDERGGGGGHGPPNRGGGGGPNGGGPGDPGHPHDDGDDEDPDPSEAGTNRTVIDDLLDAQRRMFERHLELSREAQQEDRQQAREVTFFNAQQAFDSSKYCGIFEAEKHKQDDIAYHFRKFITDWSEVENKMSVLNFRPLVKYRTLRNHLKGKALDLTYVQFPTDSHYAWAIIQLERTFYSHSQQCSNLFSNILSIEDMKNTAIGIQEFRIKYDNLWHQLFIKQPTATQLYEFVYTELLYAKCNKTCRQKIDKLKKRMASDQAPFGHNVGEAEIKEALEDARQQLAQEQSYNNIRAVVVTADETKQKKNDRKKDDRGKVSNSTQAQATQEPVSQNTGSGGAAATGGKSNSSGKPNDKKPNDGKKSKMAPGMPTHPVHKHLCPVCEQQITPKHQYVLQCPKLKKMSPKECRNFWHTAGSKCQLCFSTAHKSPECNLKNAKCQVLIETGPQAGQNCQELHNKLLHYDPKQPRENNRRNNSNQSQAATGDGSSGAGAGGNS